LVNERGFMHVSLGDLIREDTQAIYGNTNRPTLFKHANELRADFGPGVLVEMAQTRFAEANEEYRGLVISGVRSIGEAEQIKHSKGTLIFVDADSKIRYERAFARKRDLEATITYKEFIASEEKELDKPRDNKGEQNLLGVKDLADFTVDNGGTEEELIREFEKILEL